MSIAELFAALEEHDLKRLQELTRSIKTFDRRQSLRPAVTRDRSAPRLDLQLLLQLSIQHFDKSTLRSTPPQQTRAATDFVQQNGQVEAELIASQERWYKDGDSPAPTGAQPMAPTDSIYHSQHDQDHLSNKSVEESHTGADTQVYEELLDMSPCSRACVYASMPHIQSDCDRVSDAISGTTTGGLGLDNKPSDLPANEIHTRRDKNKVATNEPGLPEDKANDFTDEMINQDVTTTNLQTSPDVSLLSREEPPPLDDLSDSSDSDWDIFAELTTSSNR